MTVVATSHSPLSSTDRPNGTPLQPQSLRVAVIGCGAAGLAATHELLKEGHKVTAFEQGNRIGGIWVYTDQIEDDLLGVNPNRKRLHSSMYRGLRTNLPREVMGYSDFPFDAHYPGNSVDPRRFCTHAEVLAYLEAYAKFFDLIRYVRFDTSVTQVKPLPAAMNSWPRWQVTSCSPSSSSNIEEYDAVMVCNGHYSEPRVPLFQGQDTFPGLQTHSHNYRTPEQYKGKRIVLVGAAFSGIDIAQEIFDAGAELVVLSARAWTDGSTGEAPDVGVPQGNLVVESNGEEKKSESRKLREIIRVLNVESLNADGSVTFEGGITVDSIDEVMYTTGYVYRFPFLEGTEADISVDDNRVGPLYKHVMPPEWAPTLSFIGLPWKVVPFPQFQLQSRWVARCLSGKVTLPGPHAMLEDVEAYYKWMEEESLPKRYTHRAAGELQTQYNLWLSNACGDGDEGWTRWRQELYAAAGAARRANGLNYRDIPLETVAGEALALAAEEAKRIRAELAEKKQRQNVLS